MPHRYFTRELADGRAALTGSDAHHLADVMRARIGEEVVLCGPDGLEYLGTVTAIEARPHPGGNLQTAIVIESDGRDTLCPTVKPRDPEAVAAMSAEDLIAVIREAGITGMGGAGFPTSVKLSSASARSTP